MLVLRNYKLLSFGEEAEEDEEEVAEVNKKFSGKGKSSHDLTNDPKLSAQPAVEPSSPSKRSKKKSSKDEESESGSEAEESEKEVDKVDEESKVEVQSVRDKLKQKKDGVSSSASKSKSKKADSDDDGEEEYYLGKDEKMKQKQKVEDLRKEYKELKKSMRKEKVVQDKEAENAAKEAEEKAAKLAADNAVIKDFMDEQLKYKRVKAKAPKKGSDREDMTMALLEKFKSKIEAAKETFGEDSEASSVRKEGAVVEEGEDVEEGEEDDKPDDISWLAKKLQNENKDDVQAKDANLKGDDWFDIYDPRNTLSKRRREQSKHDSKEKKRSRINN